MLIKFLKLPKKGLNMKQKSVFLLVVLSFSTYSLSSGACRLQDFYDSKLSENYCRKLNKHVQALSKFNEINKKNKIVDFGNSEWLSLLFGNIEYENEIVKICIDNIAKRGSIEPLIKTWDFAYEMCLSHKDASFVREFAILIFSFYGNLLVAMTQQKNNQEIKGTLDDIIQVYNAVSELPLKDLILTLEKCYLLFSKLLKDYGLYSSGGWLQWLKRYWWLPPTIAIAVIGALLKRKFSKPSRPSFGKLDYLNKDGKGVQSKK